MPEVVVPIIWLQMQRSGEPIEPQHVVEPMGTPSLFGIASALLVVIVLVVCIVLRWLADRPCSCGHNQPGNDDKCAICRKPLRDKR